MDMQCGDEVSFTEMVYQGVEVGPGLSKSWGSTMTLPVHMASSGVDLRCGVQEEARCEVSKLPVVEPCRVTHTLP